MSTPAASPASWTGPKELRAQVQRLWNRGLLLAAVAGEPLPFPRRLQLKTPNSRQLSEEFSRVRDWIGSLKAIQGVRIEYRQVRHQVLGVNEVPVAAWLDSLEDGVGLLHKRGDCNDFVALLEQTRRDAPALLPWLRQQPLRALELRSQWPQLLQVANWLRENPRPDIYLRQVSIPGIDSKFIERHRSALMPLLELALPADAIDSRGTGVAGFERRYGFRGKPATLRFRLLAEGFELLPGTDRDMTLTAGDFAELHRAADFSDSIDRVFITENEVNFLAFPAATKSLVVFGAGYGFEALAEIPWLAACRIHYWGDIDTHGFAILDQLRQKYPGVRSLLMDEATLLDHRTHWVSETRPRPATLKHLTAQEQQLYQDLLDNRWGPELRLEQERIDYNYLLTRLAALDA